MTKRPTIFAPSAAIYAALAASVLQPLPLAAQDNALKLSLEQNAALRCAAAFAVIGQRQAAGEADALKYEPMGARGREFFVRSAARLMDETGASRSAIAALLQSEAEAMAVRGDIDEVMPACLIMLEASGL